MLIGDTKMTNKDYERMNNRELHKEITMVINATSLTEIDKDLLIKMIDEYKLRE